ncbi:MAG: type II CAAX endopeptidase family protein [Paludibacter sp.]|jgi:membrane protease YdiL (CAAX protease family)|nr:type II CAAX endopeptidase family protein [Paludibacter sp.]
MKSIFENASTSAKTIQLIGLTLFSFLLFSLVSMLITGGDFSSLTSLRLAQLLQSVGLFVLPPLVLAYVWSSTPSEWLHTHRRPELPVSLLVVLIMWSAIPAINLLGSLNQQIQLPESLAGLEASLKAMEAEAEALTKRLLTMNSVGEFLFTIGLVALIPAVGEELFFRGVIQKLIHTKWGPHAAVWLTALIFSAIHFQFYGFVPRMMLGALMGYLLVWSGSLWYPIVAHFVNNATVVFFYYADQRGWIHFDLENFGGRETAIAGYISIVAVSLLLWVYRRNLMNRHNLQGR